MLRFRHSALSNGSTGHWVIVPLEILPCSAGFCWGWWLKKADAEESIWNNECGKGLFGWYI